MLYIHTYIYTIGFEVMMHAALIIDIVTIHSLQHSTIFVYGSMSYTIICVKKKKKTNKSVSLSNMERDYYN